MLNFDETLPTTLPKAHDEIRYLNQLNQNLKKQNDNISEYYKNYIQRMKAHHLKILKTQFGISSEKFDVIFDEAEFINAETEFTEEIEKIYESPEISKKPQETPPRKQKRKLIPDHLARTEVVHDLKDEQKVCKKDNQALVKIGEDVSEELIYTPAKIQVIRHITPKYACPKCKEGVFCACPPKRIIPGSISSASLLAGIAVNKYMNHLPLYRQEEMFRRDGIFITRATQASWMIKVAESIQPLVNLIKDFIFESAAIQCDETTMQILKREGSDTSKKSYVWAVCGSGPPNKGFKAYFPRAVFYEIGPQRSTEVAKRLLDDYDGFLQTDDLSSYNDVKSSKLNRHLGCMAHVRRKFIDVLLQISKQARTEHPAYEIVKVIAELYKVESNWKELFSEGNALVDRAEFRKEHATKLFEKLEDLVAKELISTASQSSYGKALKYASHELIKIKHYLTHSECEIDNNNIENLIRPFALGRKNWLFSDSFKGADASVSIYTLLQTAKLCECNELRYLTAVLTRLPTCRTVEDLENLLPWNFRQT